MDWYWTVDRWNTALAIQAKRVSRRADGFDWIDRRVGATSATFAVARVGRRLVPFLDAGLIVLGVGDAYEWTPTGRDVFDAEAARRGGTVVVSLKPESAETGHGTTHDRVA